MPLRSHRRIEQADLKSDDRIEGTRPSQSWNVSGCALRLQPRLIRLDASSARRAEW